MFPRGRHIGEFVDHHCVSCFYAKGTTIHINDVEILETWAITATMVQLLDSHAFHHITGGKMMLVEIVLAETYNGWA